MKKTLLAIAIISMPSAAMAQDAMKMARATPDEVNWKIVSALPKGAEIAFLSGDPTKSDVIVERLKMPPNYQIPPHTHPYSETVTILSGRARLGFGDKVDPSATLDKSGTLYMNPARNPHYVVTGAEEAIIQVQFVGPGVIDYLNPADDPRKK
jgi:quercetin dioxygenase-like cupin family protein